MPSGLMAPSDERSSVVDLFALVGISSLGIYAGAELATWIAIGPLLASLDGPEYIAAHATLTSTFKPAMPVIGVLAIASTTWSLVLSCFLASRRRVALLASATILVGVSIALTAGHNDAINARVAEWASRGVVPAEWESVRASWLSTNFARTWTLLLALPLSVAAAFVPGHAGVRPVRRIVRALETPASREIVWDVISDLPGHGRWNRYAPRWEGELRVGEKLLVEVRPEGGRSMRFTPTVLEVEPGARVRYRQGGLLLTTDHEIRVDPGAAGGCVITQAETFSGPLLWVAWAAVERAVGPGFDRMNADLAAEATRRENRPST